LNKYQANISVIIPAYNRAALIGETLKSLLNQTVPATEIIVVDDGSTDGTAEKTLEAFENWKLETGDLKKDGREQFSATSTSGIQHPILKILHQANAGPGAARNRGLAEATGEFIHFFDSDDIAAPNKHEVQLLALLETGADIAYGPWVKGRFVNLTTEDTESTEEEAVLSLGKPSGAAFSNPSTSELARNSESTSLTRCMTALALEPRRSTLDAGPGNFIPEGPVLQAQGLPEGDLVRALLTNWSVVPHACLFRRSILEKAGGFPEDIWVGEDQLLFLRCLHAGAQVVHTPKTMVFYRVGNDPGKLTATGAAQKRHARDWGRFLLKANQEVTSGGCRVVGKRTCLITECTESIEGGQGDAQGTCAGAAFSNPSTSELARDSENTSLTRFASEPASSLPAISRSLLAKAPKAPSPATSYSLLATAPEAFTTPSAWFGFRLRAYEAWRDLERFFPEGEGELKENLKRIFLGKRKFPKTEMLKYQAAGFLLRKLAGVKLRVLGHRVKGCFRATFMTQAELNALMISGEKLQ
jgi:GT2 family glycosyltransferase